MDNLLTSVFGNRELILSLLDKVDVKPNCRDETKRRDAYVTELFFEREILPKLTSSNPVSTGWCHYTNKTDKKKCFIKVILQLEPQALDREVDREVFKAVKRNDPSTNFFVLTLTDELKYKALELIETPKYLALRETTNCNHIKIDKMYRELAVLMQRESVLPAFCSKWLSRESDENLFKLLTQRLLMNTALTFPVDIDAIELCKGKIKFHEFKRKELCPNGSFVNSTIKLCPPWEIYSLKKLVSKHLEYSGLLTKLNGIYSFNNCDKSKVYNEITTLLTQNGWRLDKEAKCYGLDLSHVSVVDFCRKNEFLYNYVIWDNPKNLGKRPTISQLFTGEHSLTQAATIYHSLIDANSFSGITRTSGDDSGSFFSGVRMQATIPFDVVNRNIIIVE